MTRKRKPSIAAKKRPAADARKPVKAAAAEKAVAPVATVREKDHRPKPAATTRKAAEELQPAAAVAAPVVQTVEPAPAAERPAEVKTGGAKNAAEKKPS